MPRPPKYLYHVTTYEKARQIIDSGYVNPKFSEGRSKVSWFVAKTRITWAIAHIARRKLCAVADLAILTVHNNSDFVARANRRGIWCTRSKLPVIEMVSADVWLDREERYVHVNRDAKRKTYRRDDE